MYGETGFEKKSLINGSQLTGPNIKSAWKPQVFKFYTKEELRMDTAKVGT